MYKIYHTIIFILATLLLLSYSFTFYGHQNSIQPENSQTLTQQQIQNGSEITPQIKSQIKKIIEQAYVFNGNSSSKNVDYIRSKLNDLYSGDWLIVVAGSFTTQSNISLGGNFGFTGSSLNNSWWIYWKGGNHYKPQLAYYIARLSKTVGNGSICYTNSNYTSTTDVFRNVINATESDFTNIQNFTRTAADYIHSYNSTIDLNLMAIDSALPFFYCQWGTSYGNIITRTTFRNLSVCSSPRV